MLSWAVRRSMLERVALDLTTYAPQEEVVHFRIYNKLSTKVEPYTQFPNFPNLRALSFDGVHPPTAFPNPNLIGERVISPSLEHIFLEHMTVGDGDWNSLVDFLAHRVSSGNRLDTLVIVSSPHMCPEVTENIRGMVRELRIENQYPVGPRMRGCCT